MKKGNVGTITAGYGLDDSSTCTITSLPAQAMRRGFCFDCDHLVEMEYDQWWFGADYRLRGTCLECGGHDVEFMGRVARRLWECICKVAGAIAKIEALQKAMPKPESDRIIGQIFEEHADRWQRLADM